MQRPPNLVLIVIDDLRRDQANFLAEGCVGAGRPRNLTPNLDRLAHEGVILDGIHTPSPICTPSRFALLTGAHASRATNPVFAAKTTLHGQRVVGQDTFIVPGQTPNLAGHLGAHGYVTGMFGKNHVVDCPAWEDVGMGDTWAEPTIRARVARNTAALGTACRAAGFDVADRLYHNNADWCAPRECAVHNLEWVTAGAVAFLEHQADASQPFFLYYASTVPHHPSPGWSSDPCATPAGFLASPAVCHDMQPRATIPGRLAAANVDESRADVLWLDDAIGALLLTLERTAQIDNTIIFVVSDHGVEGGKFSLYQGGLRNIGLAWGPRFFPGGHRSKALLCNVDIAPTLLELAGVSALPSPQDGVSFAPLLRGEAPFVREFIYGELGISHCVRTDRWKYLRLSPSVFTQGATMDERRAIIDHQNRRRAQAGGLPLASRPEEPFMHFAFVPGGWDHIEKSIAAGHPAYFESEQLYDLDADPGETTNLVHRAECAVILQELRAKLDRVLPCLLGK